MQLSLIHISDDRSIQMCLQLNLVILSDVKIGYFDDVTQSQGCLLYTSIFVNIYLFLLLLNRFFFKHTLFQRKFPGTDVYKRQKRNEEHATTTCIIKRALNGEIYFLEIYDDIYPVSYTHLDVYKRQTYNNRYIILY